MVLLSQLSQSQSASSHLREQVDSLHRHSVSLQDTCTQLQTVNTQLQVHTTPHTQVQVHHTTHSGTLHSTHSTFNADEEL